MAPLLERLEEHGDVGSQISNDDFDTTTASDDDWGGRDGGFTSTGTTPSTLKLNENDVLDRFYLLPIVYFYSICYTTRRCTQCRHCSASGIASGFTTLKFTLQLAAHQ